MATPCYQYMVYGPSADAEDPDVDLNAVIPLTGKYRLLEKVIYASDEVTPMYREFTLQFESIIYKETMTGTGNDVEAEVARLRTILDTPAQKLKLYPIGLGQFGVINEDDMDVKGGPFPQDISISPFASNRAIIISGNIMFRLSYCNTLGGEYPALLQYTVEQDMNVDDDGNMEFTTNIIYQAATPITNPNALKAKTDILTRQVGKSFQGMKKTKRTSMSRDQRTLSIRIVYKEIQSDSAFFPYTSNIQLTDDIESTLMNSGKGLASTGGFYKWKRDLNCTIRLPARVSKSWAYYVLRKILEDRFKNLEAVDKKEAIKDASNVTGQPEDAAKAKKNFFLPLRIKISNSVYDREMKFSLTYMILSSLDSIITASKILARTDASFNDTNELDPKDLSDQWKEWQDSRDTNLNGFFQYQLDGTPIIFNQCDGSVVDNHTISADIEAILEQELIPSSTVDDESETLRTPYGELSPEVSWADYKNEFEIVEDTAVVPVSYLDDPGTSYYRATDGNYANREATAMTLNGRATPSTPTNPNTVISRGRSTFFVRMQGYAIRAGYKIPTPFISEIAGKEAIRVGQPRVKHTQIAQDGDVPVYMSMWDVTYQVVGGDIYQPDIISTIKTTGVAAHYA